MLSPYDAVISARDGLSAEPLTVKLWYGAAPAEQQGFDGGASRQAGAVERSDPEWGRGGEGRSPERKGMGDSWAMELAGSGGRLVALAFAFVAGIAAAAR